MKNYWGNSIEKPSLTINPPKPPVTKKEKTVEKKAPKVKTFDTTESYEIFIQNYGKNIEIISVMNVKEQIVLTYKNN